MSDVHTDEVHTAFALTLWVDCWATFKDLPGTMSLPLPRWNPSWISMIKHSFFRSDDQSHPSFVISHPQFLSKKSGKWLSKPAGTWGKKKQPRVPPPLPVGKPWHISNPRGINQQPIGSSFVAYGNVSMVSPPLEGNNKTKDQNNQVQKCKRPH